MRMGQQFDIPLPGVPSVGYSWEFTPPPNQDIVVLLGHEWDVPGGVVGGTPTERFRFRAVGIGEVTFAFRYRRRWEQSARETRSVTVHVIR